MKTILKNKWIKVLAIIILLVIIGCTWQNFMVSKETDKFPPKGKLYSINSHNLHLYGVGKGSPTIVFVAGSGTPCAFTDFYYLQSELGRYARTVSYDHAGYGWSEETTQPRTVNILARELNELLEKAGESPPYILVGHSLASLEVIHFAQKYPNRVKGIILLDGGNPEFYSNESEMKIIMLNRLTAGLRVTGFSRILGNTGILLPFAGENLRYGLLPNEMKEIDRTMYYNTIGKKSNLRSIEKINENAQTVMNGGYLHDIPLLILSSDSGSDWEKSQKQLLKWSNMSKQETILDSDHYIHWSNRDIVIDRITKQLSTRN